MSLKQQLINDIEQLPEYALHEISVVVSRFIVSVGDVDAVESQRLDEIRQKRLAVKGSMTGQVWMADDFDAPLEDMKNAVINNATEDTLPYLLKPDANKTPVLGRLNGTIKIPDDFKEPLDEMKEYMY